MNRNVLVLAGALVLSAAVSGTSGNVSMDALKASQARTSLNGPIPLTLKGKASTLRCSTRLRFNRTGYHNRCPYGRVVTGVQVLNNNLAVLTCGEVEVTCR